VRLSSRFLGTEPSTLRLSRRVSVISGMSFFRAFVNKCAGRLGSLWSRGSAALRALPRDVLWVVGSETGNGTSENPGPFFDRSAPIGAVEFQRVESCGACASLLSFPISADRPPRVAELRVARVVKAETAERQPGQPDGLAHSCVAYTEIPQLGLKMTTCGTSSPRTLASVGSRNISSFASCW
jgi:hypothetical protein